MLKKGPPGKDVNKTDTFAVNADFTDQRYQIHINSIQSKETVRVQPGLGHGLIMLTVLGITRTIG